jgi:hypothetical protein
MEVSRVMTPAAVAFMCRSGQVQLYLSNSRIIEAQ